MKNMQIKRFFCGVMSGVLLAGNIGSSLSVITQAEEIQVHEIQEEAAAEQIEGKSKETEVKPEETEMKPEETEVKPKETEAKPEETEVKPKETEAKPEETEVKQEETEVKPEETEVKPEETEVKPEETEAKPEETETKLEETEVKPEETEMEDRVHPSLFGDDAYVKQIKIEKLQPQMYEAAAGITTESIAYELQYQIDTVSGNSYETADLYFEFLLPLLEDEAVWDTQSMQKWMNPGWKLQTEEREYDFDQDGIEETVVCQILEGSCKAGNLLTDPQTISEIPGTGSFQAVIQIKHMQTGQEAAPVFTVWMPYNQAGTEVLGNGELEIKPTGNKLACQEHERLEQKTVAADKVMIQKETEGNAESECETEQEEAFENDIALFAQEMLKSWEIGTPVASDVKAILESDGTLRITGSGKTKSSNIPLEEKEQVKKIIVEDGVTELGERLFESFHSLEEIELSDSVSSIGSCAFNGCRSLSEITIPDSVSSIGSYAFNGCRSLSKVTIPDSVKRIENSTFYNCCSLSEITIPDSVSSIGGSAFYGCSSLGKITIPDSVSSIGNWAFKQCESLVEVTLPKSITNIGNEVFRNCPKIERICVPGNLLGSVVCSDAAHSGLHMKKLYYAKVSGGAIASDVFKYSALLELVLDGDCGETAETAFLANYEGFPLRVTITNQTHEIPESFWKAVARRGIESLKFEGENTVNLTGIAGCGLKAYEKLKDGTYFIDADGNFWYLDKEKKEAMLAAAAEDTETFIVPGMIASEYTVTGIGTEAFENCPSLRSVTFECPKQITHIDSLAFYGRNALKEINGKTDSEQINALFAENAVIGWNAYAKTGLKIPDSSYEITKETMYYRNSEGDGPQMQIVTKIKDTVMEQGDSETLRVYTGEFVDTTITLTNTTEVRDNRVCVYLQMEDQRGEMSWPVGEYELVGQNKTETYKLTITKDTDNRYCLDFESPQPGDTVVFNLSTCYPSPITGGGNVLIWGEILQPGEVKQDIPDQVQKASWETRPDQWKLSKNIVYPSPDLHSKEEFGETAYVEMLYYSYKLKRDTTSTLEGVGKDYMEYVQISDTLTLPENFSWNPKLVEAVKSGQVYFETREKISDLEKNDGSDKIIFYCIADGKKYLLASVGSLSRNKGRFDSDHWKVEFQEGENGEQKLLLSWRIYNKDRSTEFENLDEHLYYGAYLIQCTMSEVAPGEKYQFTNQIETDEKFFYSENQQLTAKADNPFKIGKASISITKSGNAGYFGKTGMFKMSVGNYGAYPYTTYKKLQDELPEYFFIEPEKIEWMFSEEAFGYEDLTITIKHAALYQPLDSSKAEVTGSDGKEKIQNYEEQISASAQASAVSSGYQSPASSDLNLLDQNAQIMLKRNHSGSIQVSVESQGTTQNYVTGTDKTLKSIFTQIGYMPTKAAIYEVVWEHENSEEHPLIIYGEQKLMYQIPATVKSTFMLLEGDRDSRYGNAFYNVTNWAQIYGTDGKVIGSANTFRFTINPEFKLDASVSKDGTILTGKEKLSEQTILDHKITISHTYYNPDKQGNLTYEALPVEKLLSGCQVLMVEAAQNPELADRGLSTIEQDGVIYYLLSQDGEYKNVSIGGSIADTIKVESSGTGKNTLIRWYEKMDSNKNYTVVKNFKTYVSRSESGNPAPFYETSGMTWLGDHEAHRLYVPDQKLNGSVIQMEKKILMNPDTTQGPQSDQLADFTYIKEGEAVTYRIHLSSYTTNEEGERVPAVTTLQGSDLQDKLPKSITGFRWEKDVTVTDLNIVNADGTKEGIIYKAADSQMQNQGTAEASLSQPNADEKDLWYISSTDRNGVVYEEQENQQLIRWKDTCSITFEGDVYLYVTLHFPQGDAWINYVSAYGGKELQNTFCLRDLEDSVTHLLSAEVKGYLNKGVTSAGWTNGSETNHVFARSSEKDAKKYYTTTDSRSRVFVFYGTVYNPGRSRLYLNTVYDVLPEGFTYVGMIEMFPDNVSSSERLNTSVNVTGMQLADKVVSLTDQNHETVTWKTYHAVSQLTETKGNSQIIAFDFSKNSGLYNTDISYDKIREKYYLEPGEGIVFGYMVRTGTDQETLPQIRTNSLMMELDDYTGSGVGLGDLGANGGAVSNWQLDCDKNDGSCSLKNGSQIQGNYGITSSVDAKWLYSEVELLRGEISPGITVKPIQAISADGKTVREGFDTVLPTETVKWAVDVVNDGNEPIRDYTLTDQMPSPYVYEGDVSYNIKNADGIEWTTGTLFTIEKRNADDSQITLTLYDGSKVKLALDGTPQEIDIQVVQKRYGTSSDSNVLTKAIVQMKKAEDGTETLTVTFPEDVMAIPEHGKAVLNVQTRNPTSSIENRVYYNHAYITPRKQEFDHSAVSAGNYTEYMGEDSVTNSGLLTVAYGFTSSAVKKVTEIAADGTEGKTAESGTNPNYINLQDPEKSLLLYTQEVKNTTSEPLEKLVVIDHLPEPGDRGIFEGSPERGSEIRITFADDPNVEIWVWDKNMKNKTVLDRADYQVSYSAQTEDFTEKDWNCAPDTETVWTSEQQKESRSIRIAVLDPDGTKLPKDSVIQIRFRARVDMDQFNEAYTIEDAAGQKAFNNFGYRYRRKGDTYDLEAAPDSVGIQLPCIPKLQKVTIDRYGSSAFTEEDKAFTFLVHEGEALEDYTDSGTVSTALQKRNSKVNVVTITVPKGSSRSKAVILNSRLLQPAVYDAEIKQWKPTGERWNWAEEETYTIAEIDQPYDYASAAFAGGRGNTITFTYSPTWNRTYSCKNTLRYGAVELTKYDSDGTTPLSGVTFEIESEDGKRSTQTSASDGTLRFSGLAAGTYTITETKTISGHVLLAQPIKVTIPLAMTEAEIAAKEAETGGTVDRTKAQLDKKTGIYYFYEFGFSVTNNSQLDLPATGGNDWNVYLGLLTGILLLSIGFLWMNRSKMKF